MTTRAKPMPRAAASVVEVVLVKARPRGAAPSDLSKRKNSKGGDTAPEAKRGKLAAGVLMCSLCGETSEAIAGEGMGLSGLGLE